MCDGSQGEYEYRGLGILEISDQSLKNWLNLSRIQRKKSIGGGSGLSQPSQPSHRDYM